MLFLVKIKTLAALKLVGSTTTPTHRTRNMVLEADSAVNAIEQAGNAILHGIPQDSVITVATLDTYIRVNGSIPAGTVVL